jgi:hypothetical protein
MDNHPQEYEVHTFRDFVTPNHHATVPILGKRSVLDALNNTLSAGFHAQPMSYDNEHSAYGPLVVALNTICADKSMPPITEAVLYDLQFKPGFSSFAKDFVKTNYAHGLLNIDNILNTQGTLTEDYMVLMTAAFATFYGYGNVALGIVTLVNGQSVKAFHYPDWNHPPDYTAWIIADFRNEETVYYGIGQKTVQQQRSITEKEESPKDTVDDDADDEDTQVPTTTPRKTAARVLLQQTPLPAGLTADDILQYHKSRLQYNNLLKVALLFSNKHIAEHCRSGLRSASAVVKRISTAIGWIEGQFEIDKDAFQTAFDRERRINSISARGKDEVSDDVLAANSSKINAAMAWVRAGGPRPTQNVAPTPYEPTSDIAPVSTGPFLDAPVRGLGPCGTVPPEYISAPTIPADIHGFSTAPDTVYCQTDVVSNGDTTGSTMGVSGGDYLTNNHGRDEGADVSGMGDDVKWNPEDFNLEQFLAEDASWQSTG